MFVSLAAVSLFINVPLKKTVDIYTGKEITTTLTKRSLKKLKVTYQKTFSLLMVKGKNKQMVLVWEDL